MFVIRLMSLPKKIVILNTAGENSLTQLILVYVLQFNGELNLTVNPYTIRLSTLKHLSYLHFVCYVITLECNAVSAIFRM